jgi:tetratricopeptide (TPR) repeat protein
MRLVIAFCEKSLTAPGGLGEQRCLWAVQTYAKPLAESADQHRLAGILLRLGLDYARAIPTVFFLRLGSNLEHLRDYDMAVRIYQRIYEVAPRHFDAEVALSRLGRLMEHVYRNTDQARFYYSEQLRNHPSGRLSEDARRSLATLPYTDASYR